MLEHHRSAGWSEREYLNMYNLMVEKYSEFEKLYQILDENVGNKQKEDDLDDELDTLRIRLAVCQKFAKMYEETLYRLQGLGNTDPGILAKTTNDAAANLILQAETREELKDVLKQQNKLHSESVERESLTNDYVRLLSENVQNSEVQRAIFDVNSGRSNIRPELFHEFIDNMGRADGGKRKKPSDGPAGRK